VLWKVGCPDLLSAGRMFRAAETGWQSWQSRSTRPRHGPPRLWMVRGAFLYAARSRMGWEEPAREGQLSEPVMTGCQQDLRSRNT
jgi:hypothetical protein